ncbi:hypothetical protein LTS18_013755, partial [Coniosporium uncinatum]
MASEDWKTISQKKRESNASKIPAEWKLSKEILDKYDSESHQSVLDVPRTCGVLSEKEVEITEKYDATALLEKLAKKEMSSVEVVTAFCKRAAVAQQLIKCLTEMFFDQALERAKECDDYLAKNGKPMGPLHGLPISLKDSFNVKGVTATIGYVSFAKNPPAEQNSVLVDMLLEQGAVFYVKTNIPQTMMTADSDNNLFGRTLNPHGLHLTAGGSTGGEGSLLGFHGSVLGVGTDIAGSVRIPALCNGIMGFKPTAGRVPFGRKVPPGRLGSPGPILPCIGPEAHSIRDMELWLRTVIEAEPWNYDALTLSVPWRQVEPYNRPLKLGLLLEDKSRPLLPPILRCFTKVKEALRSAGHEVVEFTPEQVPDLWQSAILCWKIFMLDPSQKAMQFIKDSGEPLINSIPTSTFPELKDWKPTLDEL